MALPKNLSSGSRLLRPILVHSDNHLLVINKPAGWHSVPNQHRSKEKCLMTFCRQQRLGGGSQKDFLSPLHRLDQPCTGLQLYGKTSKAASRVQSCWGNVGKLYICVLDQGKRRLQKLRGLSKAVTTTDNSSWYRLGGYLKTSERTVEFSNQLSAKNQAHSEIIWSCLRSRSDEHTVVMVKTHQGHRHMIRVLLGQGCAIAGDLRYGADKPLSDQSVALHSYCLRLPTRLKLGSVQPGMILQAAIPFTWEDWFAISQSSVQDELGDLNELFVNGPN